LNFLDFFEWLHEHILLHNLGMLFVLIEEKADKEFVAPEQRGVKDRVENLFKETHPLS